GGHPEVAASAVQSPEQLGVLVLVRDDPAAVRQHQLDLGQVVADQAVLALHPAGSSAQRQSGYAGGGHPSSGGGKPVGLGGGVHVPPDRSSPHPHGLAVRVHHDGVDPPHVDDETVFDQAGPRQD